MNLHGWLLYEEGAHLAASKRLIIVSSSNSSPVINLGDHLCKISGFILYFDCLIVLVVVFFCSCSIDLSIDIVICIYTAYQALFYILVLKVFLCNMSCSYVKQSL